MTSTAYARGYKAAEMDIDKLGLLRAEGVYRSRWDDNDSLDMERIGYVTALRVRMESIWNS